MKTRRFFAVLAVFAFGMFRAAPAWAEGVVVLLSKENRIYQLILKGISDGLMSAPEIVQMDGSGDHPSLGKTLQNKTPDLLVAVGDEAARWAMAQWKSSPLLLAGVVDTMLPNRNDPRIAGVAINLPADAYFRAIRDNLPSVRRVGTIYSPKLQPNLNSSLQAAAARRGLQIEAAPASSNYDFVQSLRKMEHRIDAFLVMFDPLVLTPEAFQYLIQFSLSQDVPLVVPAFVLLKSGGVLSLEVDYEALGRQVADLARNIPARAAPGDGRVVHSPDRWQVGVNLKVARALKVKISQDAVRKADRIYE